MDFSIPQSRARYHCTAQRTVSYHTTGTLKLLEALNLTRSFFLNADRYWQTFSKC